MVCARWTRFNCPLAGNGFRESGKKVLQEYKVPYLHMKEFAFSRGPFEGWKESQRRSLLSRLLFLIKSPREPISSFSCDFEHLVFDEIFPLNFRRNKITTYSLSKVASAE